ncbi:MAG: hypothetical protein V7722_03960 [Porticoccus sp.]
MMNVKIFGLLFVLVVSIFGSVSATASCRIRIIVPENGDVQASSGLYSCEAGVTCEIEVADSDCDETFIASPKLGYSFAGWGKHSAGLCTEKLDAACGVKASILQDHPALASQEEKSEIFYLEPIFVEDQKNDRPDNFNLLCRVDHCNVETLGNREVADYSANRCANMQGSGITLVGVGQNNTLQLSGAELSRKTASGSYEALPNSEKGWKFIGQIGQPATIDGITLIVEMNEERGLCEIEYVEGANTSSQVDLTLGGLLDR